MHILIYEQAAGGHFTTYIGHLLPSLIGMKQHGVHKITLVVSQHHANMKPFKEEILPYNGTIEIVGTLTHPQIGFPLAARIKSPSLFRQYRDSVRLVRDQFCQTLKSIAPDYLLAPSADLLAACRIPSVIWQTTLRDRFCGCLHDTAAGNTSTLLGYAKHNIYMNRWSRMKSGKLLVVNPVAFEWLKKHDARYDWTLLPDPVAPLVAFSKSDARRRFGLDDQSRIVGFVGRMDQRVAIPELLDAFAHSAEARDTLFLAGELEQSYRNLISDRYGELVRNKKLVVMDQYLDFADLSAGFAACDMLAIVYYNRFSLSANLLKAIIAGRYFITNDYGFTGYMTRTHPGLGMSFNVTMRDEFADSLRLGLQKSTEYVPGPAVGKLADFHSPQNFAHVFLSHLREKLARA